MRAGKNDAKSPFIIDEFIRRVMNIASDGKTVTGHVNVLYVNGVLKVVFILRNNSL
jgi:hypothetical protein